jgi:hypothetical protein
MYHLQMFNIDAQGERIDVVYMGSPYLLASEAVGTALRLRFGTHFRITDDSGQLILDDCILAPNEN